MRREGLQAQGIYKEVPRPSRRLALATRQKIPYINRDRTLCGLKGDSLYFLKAKRIVFSLKDFY
jgi:hypothetical protein